MYFLCTCGCLGPHEMPVPCANPNQPVIETVIHNHNLNVFKRFWLMLALTSTLLSNATTMALIHARISKTCWPYCPLTTCAIAAIQWRSQNEAEEAMATPKQTCKDFYWCCISIFNC